MTQCITYTLGTQFVDGDSMTPTIAYHAKSELRGWQEVCRHPADWEGWHQFDRSMINELLQHGEQVVIIGWNMYEVVE